MSEIVAERDGRRRTRQDAAVWNSVRTTVLNDVQWTGLVRIGRQWFRFQCRSCMTADGRTFVIGFYVLTGMARWMRVGSVQRTANRARDLRAFAMQDADPDFKRLLIKAARAFRAELVQTSALELRAARMDPASALQRMPAEIEEDKSREAWIDADIARGRAPWETLDNATEPVTGTW